MDIMYLCFHICVFVAIKIKFKPIIIIIIIEFLGETRIIMIILQMIIISAGIPLVSNSFHFSWNAKYIEFWDQYILVSS